MACQFQQIETGDIMQKEFDLLDDDLNESSVVTPWELGLTMDLASDDLEDDDDLGFRALYEHPEAVLGSWHAP
jgi:hypothetical protein